MPANFKVFAPNRSSILVAWSTTYQPSEAELRAFAAAVCIPGVRLQSQHLEVAINAATLLALCRVYDVCGIDYEDVLGLVRHFVGQTSAAALWQPARPAYGYQADAALDIVVNRTKLLAFDMGCGKTGVAIQAAETVRQQRGGREPVVIIAPLFTRATWRNELLAMGAIQDASELCCLASRNFDDDMALRSAKYVFCHYDVVAAWWSKINLRKPCFVVVDEGHWIKNGRAARSNGTMMVAGTAPYRVILTGTPMSNRPGDLWHLLSVLTNPFAFGSPNDFRIRYAGAEFNGHGYADTGPTHTDELQERLATLYVRKTAEDVGLNLPPLTRRFIEIDAESPLSQHEAMTPAEMHSLVQAVQDNRVAEVLPLLTALRKETSALKLSHTVQVAADAIEQGEKVVIFTWQRATAEKIAAKLSKKQATVFCITGADDMDVRDNMVAEFQAGGADAIVATLGALREGVTLHAARIVIMHDLDWVPASLRQAERRVLRIGQHRPCVSMWMLCRKSVDMIFAAMVLRKLGSISATLGEAVDGFEELEAIADRERDALRASQFADWLNW